MEQDGAFPMGPPYPLPRRPMSQEFKHYSMFTLDFIIIALMLRWSEREKNPAETGRLDAAEMDPGSTVDDMHLHSS